MPYKHRYYPEPAPVPPEERLRSWGAGIFMACAYISLGLLIGWWLWN